MSGALPSKVAADKFASGGWTRVGVGLGSSVFVGVGTKTSVGVGVATKKSVGVATGGVHAPTIIRTESSGNLIDCMVITIRACFW